MVVHIDNQSIDSSLFRCCCINERLHLAYFIHRPRGFEGEIMLVVLFENAYDTRRFYTEYHNAFYENRPEYTFMGKAQLNSELYNRIQKSRNI